MGYKHKVEDIINTGMELIRKNGYHNVGINQILKEAKLPKGSFYNFFSSKEDFAVTILNQYGENAKETITSFLTNQDLTPLERLKSFYRMLVEANEEDKYAGGCLINTVSNEVGRNIDKIGETANDNFVQWLEVIGACIKEGQEAGEITTAYSPIALAEYIHAGLYGTFPRMKVTRTRDYLDRWYQMTFDFISL